MKDMNAKQQKVIYTVIGMLITIQHVSQGGTANAAVEAENMLRELVEGKQDG